MPFAAMVASLALAIAFGPSIVVAASFSAMASIPFVAVAASSFVVAFTPFVAVAFIPFAVMASGPSIAEAVEQNFQTGCCSIPELPFGFYWQKIFLAAVDTWSNSSSFVEELKQLSCHHSSMIVAERIVRDKLDIFANSLASGTSAVAEELDSMAVDHIAAERIEDTVDSPMTAVGRIGYTQPVVVAGKDTVGNCCMSPFASLLALVRHQVLCKVEA